MIIELLAIAIPCAISAMLLELKLRKYDARKAHKRYQKEYNKLNWLKEKT